MTPFFRNPSLAPASGPQLGPDGPFQRQQQRLPPQHQGNKLFPPRDVPARGAASATQAQVLGLAFALARLMTSPAPVAADGRLLPASSTDFQSPDSVRSVSSALARSSLVFSIDHKAPAVNFGPLPPRSLDIQTSGSPRSGSPASARTSTIFSFDHDVSAVRDSSPPPTLLIRPRQPQRRAGRAPSAPVQKCQSARIVAKAANAGGTFEDITSMAVKRKAHLNSLSGCSAGLKKHVAKKNLISRNKLPLCGSEIHKIVDAAGIACSSRRQLT